MLDDPDRPVAIALTSMNRGAYPMSHGLTRMQVRFLGTPERVDEFLEEPAAHGPEEAMRSA